MSGTASRIFFVINPNAGSGKRPGVDLIRKILSPYSCTIDIAYTIKKGHATLLAKSAIESGADKVIAVGGDGTINEVAHAMAGSKVAMGIIPCGSGNGLARHHKIPLQAEQAIALTATGRIVDHDIIRINDGISMNVSGVGFDAAVAALFGQSGKRGFNEYLRLVVKEFSNHKSHEYQIQYEGNTINTTAFLVAIANGSQYGNGAKIAPEATTGDGKINITIVQRMSGWKMPFFVLKVFAGTVGSSKYARQIVTKDCIITCQPAAPLHLDGEPVAPNNRFEIKCDPAQIKLIIP